jgi:putative membrane protein
MNLKPAPVALSSRALAAYNATLIALLAWSGWRPYDLATWAMEVVPVFIALPIVWATRRRFPLTPMLYALIFVHACVLMLGGHYSYARVPLGEWMRETFAFDRNHYDRIGHFMQGFVPAIVARELLLRHTGLQRGGWLFTVVTAVALAISAIYELIEWGTAVALGAGADEFLATQGDPWDTQKDMAMAWIGAMVAQLLLARWHDRQLIALGPPHR